MRTLTVAFASLALTLALAVAPAAAASVRSVSPSGHDSGDCIAASCLTIQYAVDQAVAGDTIMVAPGTYTGTVNVTRTVSLIGSSATIDATGHDNAVTITGMAAGGTVLRGFTIENALLEGVLAFHTTALVIAGNRIVNNDLLWDPVNVPLPCQKSDDCGEALHLWSVTNSSVTGNVVEGNVGGILLTDDNLKIVGVSPTGEPIFMPLIPPPGPTSGNTIDRNLVVNNTKDCGITLASHFVDLGFLGFGGPPTGPAPAALGGVYKNTISRNTASGNGAAGIGIFAGPPGAAAYANIVVGNTATDNGLPGVALHAHAPDQYLNDNVISKNVIARNGADDDAGTGAPTGIAVFSAVVPIQHTTISANDISDEHFGIWAFNAVTLSGLPSNTFENVDVTVSIH